MEALVVGAAADVQRGRDAFILSALTLATAAVAGVMLHQGRTTVLEAASFVTGALCVWLTVKESAWNFPVSMANVAAFLFVFWRAGLFADAGLQGVYFVLSAAGWYWWLHGGANRGVLRISRVPRAEAAAVAVAGVLIASGLFASLRHAGGSSPFWDATTTALSLCAQWLLNRKYLETWYCWIAVDVMYVPLYLSKSLYLTAGLYAVFLCMATMGLLAWRATWRNAGREGRPEPRGFEVLPAGQTS